MDGNRVINRNRDENRSYFKFSNMKYLKEYNTRTRTQRTQEHKCKKYYLIVIDLQTSTARKSWMTFNTVAQHEYYFFR